MRVTSCLNMKSVALFTEIQLRGRRKSKIHYKINKYRRRGTFPDQSIACPPSRSLRTYGLDWIDGDT